MELNAGRAAPVIPAVDRPTTSTGAVCMDIAGVEVIGEAAPITITAWPLIRGIGTAYIRRLLRDETSRYLDAEIVDDLETVVSELGTNAMCHTDGPCELRVVKSSGVPVLCEVADVGDQIELIATRLAEADSTDDPSLATGEAETGAVADPRVSVAALPEGGLGLGIVAVLTNRRCGVHPTRLHGNGMAGKSVWFEIPATDAQSVLMCSQELSESISHP